MLGSLLTVILVVIFGIYVLVVIFWKLFSWHLFFGSYPLVVILLGFLCGNFLAVILSGYFQQLFLTIILSDYVYQAILNTYDLNCMI